MTRLSATTRQVTSSRSAAVARTALSQNYTVSSGTLLEDFESVGAWTAAGSGGGSIAAETTNFKTGVQSLQLTASNGNESATKVISTSGASMGVIGYWVYIPDITNLFGITTYLSSSTTLATSFSYQVLKAKLRNGWNFISIARNDWTNNASESWTNTFVRLRVRVDTLANQTCTASFDSLYYDIYARPKVLVIFDDGRSTAYTQGFSYMQNYNMPGTVGVNSSNVGTAGWATLTQLQEMYSAGWDMANHGATHAHMPQISAPQQLTEITTTTGWLTASGFDLARGGRHFIYPYGEYDTNALTNTTTAGMSTARSIIAQNQSTVKGIDNDRLLFAKELAQSISITTAKGYVDNCIATGTTLILFAHSLVVTPGASTEWPIADFQGLIDYIARYRDGNLLDVVTVSQWFRGLGNSRKVL